MPATATVDSSQKHTAAPGNRFKITRVCVAYVKTCVIDSADKNLALFDGTDKPIFSDAAVLAREFRDPVTKDVLEESRICFDIAFVGLVFAIQQAAVLEVCVHLSAAIVEKEY